MWKGRYDIQESVRSNRVLIPGFFLPLQTFLDHSPHECSKFTFGRVQGFPDRVVAQERYGEELSAGRDVLFLQLGNPESRRSDMHVDSNKAKIGPLSMLTSTWSVKVNLNTVCIKYVIL
jgi:hypothetical protein